MVFCPSPPADVCAGLAMLLSPQYIISEREYLPRTVAESPRIFSLRLHTARELTRDKRTN